MSLGISGAAWLAAGAVAGGAIAASGAKSAASTQANAALQASQQSNDTQLQMFNQTRADQQPWLNAGGQALGRLAYGLGVGSQAGEAGFDRAAYLKANPDVAAANVDPWEHYQQWGIGEGRAYTPLSGAFGGDSGYGDLSRDFTLADFQKDPGYDFRMAEGQKAIERSAAARSGSLNGATLKAIGRYGQDYASGEYTNAYNRFNNDRTQRFNRLATVAGVGQTAATNLGATGTQVAANIGNTTNNGITSAGAAQAAGTVGAANAWNSTGQTLGNYYLQNQWMKSLNPGMSSAERQGAYGGG